MVHVDISWFFDAILFSIEVCLCSLGMVSTAGVMMVLAFRATRIVWLALGIAMAGGLISSIG